MTAKEAIKILDAKSRCIERSVTGKNIFCNNNKCDCCELNYAQGTMGEQIEAFNMAVNALKEKGK